MDADFLETIRTVFQDFNLMQGTWDVRSPAGKLERVRPQDISGTALLTVEGELDDISGSGQTKAAHDLCTGIPAKQGLHYEVPQAGHYGIFSGRRWRQQVYPRIKDFIAAHPLPPGAASAPSASVTQLDVRPARGSAKSARETRKAA
jgi:poly(3-hydroxybutyrate) depolymerase